MFILDEPESALSPTSQFRLLKIIHDLSSNHDCQFIIATHSPILAAYANGDIYELSGDAIVKKTYLDTNLYALYHRFINDDEYRQKIIEE
jgi:Predicted ATPase